MLVHHGCTIVREGAECMARHPRHRGIFCELSPGHDGEHQAECYAIWKGGSDAEEIKSRDRDGGVQAGDLTQRLQDRPEGEEPETGHSDRAQ